MNKRFALFTILSLVFIAMVLRPPIAAIGPLLQEIAASLSLDSSQQGLLTAVPVLCFGAGAFVSPWLMRRLGLNKSMLLVLVILFLAVVLRAWFGFEILLLGTVMVGLAIAVANVLLPTLVRVDFANQASLLTSVYTTLLAISASVMAATAVLFSEALGGWQFSLLLTALPVFFAIVFWSLRLSQKHISSVEIEEPSRIAVKSIQKSALAWSLLGLFAIQSLGFYVLIGWLPTILVSAGLTPAVAGGYLGLATAIGIPSGFAIAPLIARAKSLSLMIAIASLLTTLGFTLLGLLLLFENASSTPLLILVCTSISVGQAATFPMVLSLIATRAKNQQETTALSAFSQGWGYLFSAAGTFAFGAIAALLSSFSAVVFGMALLSAAQMAFGVYAGRDPRKRQK